MIHYYQQQINKYNIQEDIIIDQSMDADGDRIAYTNKMITQYQNRITKYTAIVAEYKTKVTFFTTQVTTTTTKVTALRAKVTELKTLIDQKTQEILELTATLREKQDFLEKNPSATYVVAKIEELKTSITTIEKFIRTTRKDYIAAYSESVSMQKLIEFFTS